MCFWPLFIQFFLVFPFLDFFCAILLNISLSTCLNQLFWRLFCHAGSIFMISSFLLHLPGVSVVFRKSSSIRHTIEQYLSLQNLRTVSRFNLQFCSCNQICQACSKGLCFFVYSTCSRVHLVSQCLSSDLESLCVSFVCEDLKLFFLLQSVLQVDRFLKRLFIFEVLLMSILFLQNCLIGMSSKCNSQVLVKIGQHKCLFTLNGFV